MSRQDDKIAGSTPPQQPLPRKGSIARTIGQVQERGYALPISAVASITTHAATVIVKPAKAQADSFTAFWDRWLKFALPRKLYRKQIAPVIADWDHELEEAEAPRLWIHIKNVIYLLWAIARWPVIVWLVWPFIDWFKDNLP